jgi:hypothetical protein
MEWGTLPTLYEASGEWYKMAQRMAPKTVTLWAHGLFFPWGMVQGSRVLTIEKHL